MFNASMKPAGMFLQNILEPNPDNIEPYLAHDPVGRTVSIDGAGVVKDDVAVLGHPVRQRGLKQRHGEQKIHSDNRID